MLRRFGAAAIDFAIYALWMLLFSQTDKSTRDVIALIVFLFLFILPEFVPRRATIGKRTLGLFVSSRDGASWRRLLRSLLKLCAAFLLMGCSVVALRDFTSHFGSTILSCICTAIVASYLAIPFLNRNRQFLHDLVCGCVIRRETVAS